MIVYTQLLSASIVLAVLLGIVYKVIARRTTQDLSQGIYRADLLYTTHPNSIVIALDIHDVLFSLDYTKLYKRLYTMQHKLIVSKHLINPVFWYRAHRIFKKTRVAEDIFNRLTVLYPELASVKAGFTALTNAQSVDRKVLSIAKELRAKGYKLYILSNIGKETFEQLKHENQDVISLFDGVYVAVPANNYAHKPQRIFYEGFKHYLNHEGHHNKHVLLIDDSIAKIKGAARADIAGLVFISPARLHQHLRYLNIIDL